MGQRKKVGKERQDKYYYLAKAQGYRARSAFKLIQLNKKFGFLNNARVAIDLCAAPGGWLQVCSKYMPMSSVIVGVDLVKIKPIPNVITHAVDITTDKCRALIKRDLKDWKADVVMNDGAPNVGSAWLQDAFTQSELVLAALKLAVEFLGPGGTFVTKIFRSKDYNNLMFVFNQLFKRVEATKPPSSRNVSAEIFVVCRDFIAPKKIDPRFLDAKFVFKDIEQQEMLGGDSTVSSGLAKVSMQNLLNPEKAAKRRHRDGYKDGDYTLHEKRSVMDFLLGCRSENEATVLLAQSHEFVFEPREGHLEEDKEYLEMINSHPDTDEELRECFKDLKVLGRKEFKTILKWRKTITKLINPQPTETASTKEETEETAEAEYNETAVVEQLDLMVEEASRAEKRAERKRRLRMAKDRQRLALNMTTPTDIAMDADGGESLLKDDVFIGGKGDRNVADVVLGGEEYYPVNDLSSDEEEEVYLGGSQDDSDSDDEEEEDLEKEKYLEQQVDSMYNDYLLRVQERNAKLKVKAMHESETFEDFNGEGSQSESEEEEEDGQHKVKKPRLENDEDFAGGDLWFQNPVFDNLSLNSETESDESDSEDSDYEEDSEEAQVEKTKKKLKQKEFKEGDYEESLPSDQESEHYTQDPKDVLSTAAAVDLAMQMVQDGGRMKRDLLDDRGYNRYTFSENPNDLPAWFVTDEQKHNRPIRPISKEAVELIRKRQKEIDARPIKKVAEAKARKKYKANKKLESLRKKMNDLMEGEGGSAAHGEDLEAASKLTQIDKTMRRSLAKSKMAERKRAKLVVARGSNKAQHGRPKGVKGRYKMVDSRLKKDARAAKRIEKQQKKRK